MAFRWLIAPLQRLLAWVRIKPRPPVEREPAVRTHGALKGASHRTIPHDQKTPAPSSSEAETSSAPHVAPQLSVSDGPHSPTLETPPKSTNRPPDLERATPDAPSDIVRTVASSVQEPPLVEGDTDEPAHEHFPESTPDSPEPDASEALRRPPDSTHSHHDQHPPPGPARGAGLAVDASMSTARADEDRDHSSPPDPMSNDGAESADERRESPGQVTLHATEIRRSRARLDYELPRQPGEPRRIGPRRRPNPTGDTGPRLPPVRVKCTRHRNRWRVVIEIPRERNIERATQGNEEMDLVDGRLFLSRLRQPVRLFPSNGDPLDIPLFDNQRPLFFRLSGTEPDLRGELSRTLRRGRFLAFAPPNWKRSQQKFRASELCTDPSLHCHHYEIRPSDDADSLGTLGDYPVGSDKSARLEGTTVLDSDDDELFVGDPPRLWPAPGIVWARVGEEHPRAAGRHAGPADEPWKGKNFELTEQPTPVRIGNRRGEFFLRTYQSGHTHLADTTTFRYWPGLKRILVNGLPFEGLRLLLPDDRDEDYITIEDSHGRSLQLNTGTRDVAVRTREARVPYSPKTDRVRLELRDGDDSLPIVLDLPRLWWRMAGDSCWERRPLRRTYRRHAALEVLAPPTERTIEAAFADGQPGRYRHEADSGLAAQFPHKTAVSIPLGSFADLLSVQSEPASGELRLRAGSHTLPALLLELPSHPSPSQSPPALTPRLLTLRPLSRRAVAPRHRRFVALVAVGDRNGRLGVGRACESTPRRACARAEHRARRALFVVPISHNTIPRATVGAYGSSRLLLRPASADSGVHARGRLRALLETAGIRSIRVRSIGSRAHVVNAAVAALRALTSR